MRGSVSERISVLRNDEIVPLLPLAGSLDVQTLQPWRGIKLERHRTGTMEIPEHQHADLCLHLQLSGSVEMEWWCEGGNAVEKTRPGSLVLLHAGTRDRLRWKGSSERLVLSVAPELMEGAASEMGSSRAVEFRNQWTLEDAGLQHMVMEMGREAGAGWPLGGLYADLLGGSFAEMLLRRHGAEPLRPVESRGGLSLAQVRRVLEFVTANLDRDLRLAQMAAEVGMTPFHFARRFRQSVGTSPYQYVLAQRLSKAQRMLKASSLPVQTVAALTGWSSAANFVRAFRQEFGVTPQRWRKA